MAKLLVPDDLWVVIAPLLPPERPKPKGGRLPIPDQAALTGIIFVLRTGLPWEYLPAEMGCGSGMSCWRRLHEWHKVRGLGCPAPRLAGTARWGRTVGLAPGRAGQRQRARQKFVVLPKRWIVERTIAWLNRCRRLSKDWECLNRNALTFLRWASVRLMLRSLCQTST